MAQSEPLRTHLIIDVLNITYVILNIVPVCYTSGVAGSEPSRRHVESLESAEALIALGLPHRPRATAKFAADVQMRASPFDARRTAAHVPFLEPIMTTGQTAFLVLCIVAISSLPLTLLWAVIYTNLGDRRDRETSTVDEDTRPKSSV